MHKVLFLLGLILVGLSLLVFADRTGRYEAALLGVLGIEQRADPPAQPAGQSVHLDFRP